MDIETIGLNIRKCRNAKKMRQEDLAQKANVSSNYISAVERGVKIPSVETLIDIMNALGVSADMIFCDVIDAGVGMSSVLLEKRGKTYLNSFCFGFRPSEKIDSYYLAYMLRSESAREKIILLAQGISRYNISKNKVMEIAVSLPSLDEQKLIGQCFRPLDHLITLHQRKPFLMKWRTSDANRNQTNRLVL